MDESQDAAAFRAYETLQSLLVSLNDVQSFLEELSRLAASLMPAVECGITSRYNGNVITVASSDTSAALLDETQYETNGGPCLLTLDTGQIVPSRDTRSETRWPSYTEVARQAGLRCSLSLPLAVNGVALGAMNLYCFNRPDAFGAPEQHRFEMFAAQAAGALRLATRQIRDSEHLSQLEQALTSRTVIDQAMGIIICQQRCTAEQAFALLRAESQNNQRKLRDVAADLVRQMTGEEPQTGRPFDSS